MPVVQKIPVMGNCVRAKEQRDECNQLMRFLTERADWLTTGRFLSVSFKACFWFYQTQFSLFSFSELTRNHVLLVVKTDGSWRFPILFFKTTRLAADLSSSAMAAFPISTINR